MAFQTLSKGSQGEAVISLQKWLNLAAKLQKKQIKLKPDGDFGATTEKALVDLVGITAVNENTAQAMAKATLGMLERAKDVNRAPDMALRAMITQDQLIFQKLLEIYRIYEKSSPETRQKYKVQFAKAFDCASRLMGRLKKMKGSSHAIAIATGFPEEYRPLVARYVKSAGVGLAPLAVIGVVAIAAIFIGGVATYGFIEWLTPAYSESTVDFKQTAEIKQILEQLPASDKATLIAEVEKQVDKAYVTGKKDGKLDGFFGGTKTLLVFGGGLALYFLVVEPAMDNRKARRATA